MTIQIVIEHTTQNPLTHAFRVNLTVFYPTEYLTLNESSPLLKLHEESNVTETGSTEYSLDLGEVIFRTDELENSYLVASVDFAFTDNVERNSIVEVTCYLEWHNLPYELASYGGREYSTTGSDEVCPYMLTTVCL